MARNAKTLKIQEVRRYCLLKEKAKSDNFAGLLASVLDWQLTGDLGKPFKFPPYIVPVSLWTDIVLFLPAIKQLN